MGLQKPVLQPHGWVNAHADYLYAFTITRINDVEKAKDLVQETFLAALEKVNTFEGRSSERTWLTAILKNKIVDVYRKKSSLVLTVSVADAEREQQDFFEDSGHWTQEHKPLLFGTEQQQGLEQKEFHIILKKCMNKLPALWATVFTMKHMDDETAENICTQLKVTPSNYWVIIHRAKLSLRECMQKNWN